MKYMGSKDKHAKQIIAITLARRAPGQTYVEPFVGGANVLKYVPQEQGPRIGADVNRYMVALHTALANGWEPPQSFTKTEYAKIQRGPESWAKAHGEFGEAIVGFVATGCTFGSTWMGAWVKDYDPEERTDIKDHSRCAQSARSCLRDAPGLKGAIFVCSSYDKLVIPDRSIVYCDPPYANTSSYVGERDINRWKIAPFWQWADRQVDAGHTVYVSEYTGPTAECMALPDDPEILDELQAAQEEHVLAQGKDWYVDAKGTVIPEVPAAAPDVIEACYRRVMHANGLLTAARQRLADRWKVVWSKEVTADFSATREAGVKTGKVEVEKLFHREA